MFNLVHCGDLFSFARVGTLPCQWMVKSTALEVDQMIVNVPSFHMLGQNYTHVQIQGHKQAPLDRLIPYACDEPREWSSWWTPPKGPVRQWPRTSQRVSSEPRSDGTRPRVPRPTSRPPEKGGNGSFFSVDFSISGCFLLFSFVFYVFWKLLFGLL